MPDVGELGAAVVAARHPHLAVELGAGVVTARREIRVGGHQCPGDAVRSVPDIVLERPRVVLAAKQPHIPAKHEKCVQLALPERRA